MSNCCPFRYLPREVDPLVYNMSHEDPGNVSYSEIGGLSEQIRELREVQHTFPLQSAASCAFCCAGNWTVVELEVRGMNLDKQ